MTQQLIKDQTDLIARALSQSYDTTNPDEIIGKIQEFSSLLGTSCELVAMSEAHYSKRVMEVTESLVESKMGATDKKYIINGRCREQAYLMTLCERQNRALTHAIDGLRSMLSFIKQDLASSQYQTT